MNFFERLFRQNLINKTMGSNSVAPDGIVRNNAPNNGLLSNNNKGFFGSFNNINPNLILGANMIGQGIQGKDPFSSFAPALQQTGQLQSQFMQMEEMKNKMAENKKARDLAQKQRNYFESLPDNHPFKALAEAFPKAAATGVIQMELKNIDETYKKDKDKKKAIQDFTKNIQDREEKLATAYIGNKVVQEFDAATQSVTKLFSGLEANDGVGDLAAIFTFMKTLDPSSVVRESEFATAENSSGVYRKFWNLRNKVMKGERLTKEQRNEFKEVALGLYQQQQQGLDNIQNSFSQIADNQGLNIDNIFIDSDIRPRFENIIDKAAPGAEKQSFTKFRLPPGARLVDYKDGKYFFQVPGRKDFIVTDGLR
ncbi:virion structural protein [uncultured Mediterranean phage uvMED]|nr:virion structural protein [uncultured Mediterranean phage uvMED]